MIIAIAADHAGKTLKQSIIDFLKLNEHQCLDYGVDSCTSHDVDYPQYAAQVAQAVSTGDCSRGILICGTGIGMCIVANKFADIRAAVVHDELSARLSREHNDTNIICLGARNINSQTALNLLSLWLQTQCTAERHKKRIYQISAIEQRIIK